MKKEKTLSRQQIIDKLINASIDFETAKDFEHYTDKALELMARALNEKDNSNGKPRRRPS